MCKYFARLFYFILIVLRLPVGNCTQQKHVITVHLSHIILPLFCIVLFSFEAELDKSSAHILIHPQKLWRHFTKIFQKNIIQYYLIYAIIKARIWRNIQETIFWPPKTLYISFSANIQVTKGIQTYIFPLNLCGLKTILGPQIWILTMLVTFWKYNSLSLM